MTPKVDSVDGDPQDLVRFQLVAPPDEDGDLYAVAFLQACGEGDGLGQGQGVNL